MLLALLAFAACHSGGAECTSGTCLQVDAALPPPEAALTCGAGTAEVNGICLPLAVPGYEVRIAESMIGANGRTKRKVVVFGTKPDGTPATDRVVLTLDRASAGRLQQAALNLGVGGASTVFVPCSGADADCLGPARLTVALASAPAVPLAHVDFELVAPTGVSSIAPCRDESSLFYIDGNSYLIKTTLVIDRGGFGAQTFANEVSMNVTGDENAGWWRQHATARRTDDARRL